MPNSRPNSSTPPDPAELWDRSQAARYLRRGQSTFDRQVAAGRIPCYRLSGRVLFDPADLRSLVASAYNPASSED
jgi:Helix-turn-helix domain